MFYRCIVMAVVQNSLKFTKSNTLILIQLPFTLLNTRVHSVGTDSKFFVFGKIFASNVFQIVRFPIEGVSRLELKNYNCHNF